MKKQFVLLTNGIFVFLAGLYELPLKAKWESQGFQPEGVAQIVMKKKKKNCS